MSFIAAFTGCCVGLCTKLYTNAIRKVPYMREPWEHAIYMALGGFGFYYGKKFVDKEKLSLRGMISDMNRVDLYDDKKELKP